MENKCDLMQKCRSCYVCGSSGELHIHHIFYGSANRRKSDEDKMMIYLCPAHHNMSNAGVHFNKTLDDKIKMEAQKVWMMTYASDEEDKVKAFIKRYGRNYLD